MFDNTKEFIDYCKKNNKSVGQVSLERELNKSKLTKDMIYGKLEQILSVMENSSKLGLDTNMSSMGGLIGKEAKLLEDYRKNNETLSGDFILSAAAKSLSTSQVNACMGKIVAAPTAGASGILPSIIFSIKDKFNLKRDDIALAMLTSATIGEIIATKASISGAEGGCQAECGSAAAMAAGALVELRGGSAQEVFNAASFALINIMGLICDPVAGLVEFPCNIRNASGTYNAYLSADMALAGIESPIPFDQVVEAMNEVGNLMHTSLKETALGGLANTEVANQIKKDLLGGKL